MNYIKNNKINIKKVNKAISDFFENTTCTHMKTQQNSTFTILLKQ